MPPTSSPRRFSWRRALRNTILILTVLGVVLFVAARWLLSSSLVVDKARAHLETVLGVPVQLDSGEISLFGGSTFRGMSLEERDASAGSRPWLRVERVDVAVSAMGLLFGEGMPRDVSLHGATLELRFDSAGNLLTRLPQLKSGDGAMPALHLENGRLILDQQGRTPLVLGGIHGLIHSVEGEIRLEGNIADPEWSQWSFTGTYRASASEFSLELHNAGMHVTRDRLATLPLIDPGIWDEVRAEGDTPVDFTVRHSTIDSSTHYRVELRPERTTVRIRAIDLSADQARGRVVVEDGKVRLRDVVGRTAGGRITTSADLDFTSSVYRLDFKPIAVEGVSLKDLPSKWSLPPALVRLGGTLTGSTRLDVTIDKEGVWTRGDGKGTVRTTLAGKEADIGLKLHASGKNIEFGTDDDGQQSLREALLLSLVALQKPVEEPKASLPWKAVNQVPRGLTELGKSISAGANAVLDGVKQTKDALDPAKPPTYLTASLKLEDVDAARLLQDLDVKLPFAIKGRLSFDVKLDLPVNATADYRAYRLRGSANLKNADVAGLLLSEVRGGVRLDKGVLSVEELRGIVPPVRKGDPRGGFTGTARMGLFPLGDLTAELKLTHLPLDVLLNRLPGTANLAHGLLDGDFKLQVPADRLSEPAAYSMTGTVRADRLEAYGLTLTKAAGQLSLAKGIARVKDLHSEVEGAPVTLEGQADLTAKGLPYEAKAELQKADLAALKRLSSDFRPPLDIEGTLGVTARLRGTLTPLTLTASGTVKATKLSLARIRLDEVSAAWARDGDALALTDVDARLYGGRVTGKATLPLTAAASGKLSLTVSEMEAKDIAGALAPLPLRLEGRIAGTLTADLGAADKNGSRKTTLDVELTAGQLRIQKIPTQHVKGTLRQVEGHLEYKLVGDVLGGKFELEGKTSARPDPRKDEEPSTGEGRLRLVGLRLSRLGAALGMGNRLDPLQGRLELELNYKNEGPDNLPVGTGRVSVIDVRWGGVEVSDGVRGDLRLTERDLQIRDLGGVLDNGLLRAVVIVRLREPGGWFSLTLEHVDAERVLAPFPSLTDTIKGPLDVQLRGSVGNALRASGQATLHRGHTLGVGVSEWRLPIEIGHDFAGGEGYLDVRDSTAQLGQGRAQGHASLRWGEGVRLDGLLTFYNADLKTLLQSAGDLTTYANGRLTGRLEFGAANLRSLDDLTAIFTARLNQTQAFQLPVLSALTPFLAPGRGNTSFDEGSIRARLSGGVVRVQQLSLSGSLLRVLIEGTITLSGGRLNLEATAGTGDMGASTLALRALASRVPAIGPVPVGLIAQVTAFFANRLVHLHIGGTLRNPSIHVDPVALLTEEAVRYFVLNPFGLYPSLP